MAATEENVHLNNCLQPCKAELAVCRGRRGNTISVRAVVAVAVDTPNLTV